MEREGVLARRELHEAAPELLSLRGGTELLAAVGHARALGDFGPREVWLVDDVGMGGHGMCSEGQGRCGDQGASTEV
ncbi:hypothetical protein MFU01_27040 [Myxococcus fulvus]|uniref:Uncharacterized protein n=1 Tax=Myxococcus fulvus TaxID=33 RepID=A0A511T1B3_MYXFU|nr:hypothetical protein MFU01_27040 [Myxococcus fulvus]